MKMERFEYGPEQLARKENSPLKTIFAFSDKTVFFLTKVFYLTPKVTRDLGLCVLTSKSSQSFYQQGHS